MTIEKIMKHHTEGGRMIRHYDGKIEYILSEDDMNFILGLVNNLDIPVVITAERTFTASKVLELLEDCEHMDDARNLFIRAEIE